MRKLIEFLEAEVDSDQSVSSQENVNSVRISIPAANTFPSMPSPSLSSSASSSEGDYDSLDVSSLLVDCSPLPLYQKCFRAIDFVGL